MGRQGRSLSRRPELVKFEKFVTDVLIGAQVKTPVVLASLVYVARAKPSLYIGARENQALEYALYRVFLGTLVIASKVCFDHLQSLR